ncbi:uncharacterized protein LOC133296119 [Gastrolobium bilobum]|uniref:uncharacterized protein LOC133296119 n=1 Tax=Gastrolobium bilobum TaxID=150636 RepID=UPI002AB14DDB|nr:uncharacterized protein LOC133296119 [Gastrolobium bilobum]
MARGSNNNRPPQADASSGSSASMDDSSSLYFLQSGDHPGLILVSHTLSGSNFHSWRRAMLLALTAKNKLSFIDGSLLRPPPTDLLFSAWIRCNSMVISWILNSVSKDIADSLLYFSNAYEVWTDLATRFSQANGPRIFQLKQQISLLSQGPLDVSAYYTKLKALWDELHEYLPLPTCTCGALRQIALQREQDHVLQFLIGLTESFSSARAQILLLDPLPSLAKVFSLILQEERQCQISLSSPSSAISESPLLNSTTAILPTPPLTAAAKGRSKPYCTYCHLSGHVREKCFKLHGYPPGYKPTRNPRPNIPSSPLSYPRAHFIHSAFPHHSSHSSPPSSLTHFPSSVNHGPPTADPPLAFTPTQYNQLLTLLQQSSAPSSPSLAPSSASSVTESFPSVASFNGRTSVSIPSSSWVLDTGATHHVCISSSLFVSSSPSSSFVSFPNGSLTHVSAVGSVFVTDFLKLFNVLFVPSFHFNLLSIPSLTRDSPIIANFLLLTVFFRIVQPPR